MAAVELLRRLAFNGIDVHQLDEAVTLDGITHPAGTWVIPTDQEFGHFVRQLFDVQEYPDLREYPEGPPDQPYDVSGWTLPYQMDVRVVEAASPLTADPIRLPHVSPWRANPHPGMPTWRTRSPSTRRGASGSTPTPRQPGSFLHPAGSRGEAARS